MWNGMRDGIAHSLIGLVLAFSLLAVIIPPAFAQSDADALRRAVRIQGEQLRSQVREGSVTILVNPGDQNAAEKYYDEIAPLINFKTLRASDLTGLLVYLGFEGLKAPDLELIPSDQLMPKSKAEFDVLASKVSDPALFKSKRALHDFVSDKVLVSRFFAPKIVNYNAEPNAACPVAKPDCKQNPYNAGWRKLVRLVPVAKSDADAGNIGEAYILLNYLQADAEKSPFPVVAGDLKPGTESGNNQVILVPKSRKSKTDDAAFWMVYQPSSKGYKLGFALNAAFDVIEAGAGTKDYFVPMACAQCHGHDEINSFDPPKARPFAFAKTNYLDTDQWYDMADFDFPGTKNSNYDVIFDGEKDHKDKKYAAAVGVLSKINQHIKKQNQASLRPKGDPLFDGYKVAAVTKWLDLHKTNPQPVSIFKRSIGAKQWNEKKALDAKLLPQLDRFCFRCHSTVRFDVFDRKAVKARSLTAAAFVDAQFMPQGRKLSDQERADLVKLLNELGAEK
jgi:hypothetical protein